ncbi:Crp/Fnr family transcriptional regulator [Phytomonospora sp. NPDC050363]|uniref:Crp/Fnr family transcriptional regulator n=1 Tax=Phytomonospora sp. NPDC050363 TaxID=3155642 RepID=UPI0033C366A7
MGQSIIGEPTPYSTKADLDELEKLGRRHDRPAGQILIEENEDSDHVLFLLSGYVKILVSWPKRAVAIRAPGYFIGEMAAIRKQKRSAQVVALTDIQALLIPADKFLQYLVDHPTVMLGLLRETDERLLELTRKTASAELNSELKLAKVILELIDLGLGTSNGTAVRLRFGQRDLGELAGVSRESVAKAVAAFKKQDLVSVGRGSVTILDPQGLRRLADSETDG